jgi:outer membrane protein OmpA-like peptidoglycan-associated protein
MKRSSLFCAGAWPFIFLPLLLLLPLLFFKWHSIEEDVARNVSFELSQVGIEWVKVETTNRGRDALITGTPPSQQAIEAATKVARTSYGVNKVDVSSDVTPIITPKVAAELKTIITNERLVLRGTVANQESVNALVSDAEKAFGIGNVTNKLEVGENISALPNLDGFFLTLTDKSFSLETLTATLVGNQLSLKGTVISDVANAMLETQMANGLRLQVTNSLTVAVPPIKPDTCADLISELLSGSTIEFACGETTLKEGSSALLANIKSTTSALCPDASLEVSGHTDSSGPLSFNMKLSQQRAQAVVDYLAGLGPNTTTFIATGFGPNKPIADNNTAEGRAHNRRVEFKLNN